MIRRCGNCAWGIPAPKIWRSLDLICNHQISSYYRKKRSRGYFACRQHHFPMGTYEIFPK